MFLLVFQVIKVGTVVLELMEEGGGVGSDGLGPDPTVLTAFLGKRQSVLSAVFRHCLSESNKSWRLLIGTNIKTRNP